MNKKEDKRTPYFVTSHDFHGDAEYVAWLQEIKRRYQRIRSRIALQANYGTLEFNWLLGRDLVEKKAEQRWGTGVVEQLSLDMRAEYPDIKGFSSRNLWYMKQWYLFYCGDTARLEKLHQLGAELQAAENKNPMGVATYQGIKIADKLPSVEALQERIKMLEAQLEQGNKNE